MNIPTLQDGCPFEIGMSVWKRVCGEGTCEIEPVPIRTNHQKYYLFNSPEGWRLNKMTRWSMLRLGLVSEFYTTRSAAIMAILKELEDERVKLAQTIKNWKRLL